MMPRVVKRINLIDLMVLTAASALGIAAWRSQLRSGGLPGAWWVIDAQMGSVWFAVILGLALAIIQYRQGRAERKRLLRRPGFSACLASLTSVAMILFMLLLQKLINWLHRGVPFRFMWSDLTERLFTLSTMVTPCCVGAVWLVMVIGGTWRPGRDAIDRVGILLGFYWVTWNIVAELVVFGS